MRFLCAPSHIAYDNPFVDPDQRGRSHLHTFLGNSKADGYSTYGSLRTSGDSSCNTLLNRSAYWMPAMVPCRPNATGGRRYRVRRHWYKTDGTLDRSGNGSTNVDTWYLASDRVTGMASSMRGTTLHADLFGAWGDSSPELWQANRIDKMLSCNGGDLGNGQQLQLELVICGDQNGVGRSARQARLSE